MIRNNFFEFFFPEFWIFCAAYQVNLTTGVNKSCIFLKIIIIFIIILL